MWQQSIRRPWPVYLACCVVCVILLWEARSGQAQLPDGITTITLTAPPEEPLYLSVGPSSEERQTLFRLFIPEADRDPIPGSTRLEAYEISLESQPGIQMMFANNRDVNFKYAGQRVILQSWEPYRFGAQLLFEVTAIAKVLPAYLIITYHNYNGTKNGVKRIPLLDATRAVRPNTVRPLPVPTPPSPSVAQPAPSVTSRVPFPLLPSASSSTPTLTALPGWTIWAFVIMAFIIVYLLQQSRLLSRRLTQLQGREPSALLQRQDMASDVSAVTPVLLPEHAFPEINRSGAVLRLEDVCLYLERRQQKLDETVAQQGQMLQSMADTLPPTVGKLLTTVDELRASVDVLSQDLEQQRSDHAATIPRMDLEQTQQQLHEALVQVRQELVMTAQYTTQLQQDMSYLQAETADLQETVQPLAQYAAGLVSSPTEQDEAPVQALYEAALSSLFHSLLEQDKSIPQTIAELLEKVAQNPPAPATLQTLHQLSERLAQMDQALGGLKAAIPTAPEVTTAIDRAHQRQGRIQAELQAFVQGAAAGQWHSMLPLSLPSTPLSPEQMTAVLAEIARGVRTAIRKHHDPLGYFMTAVDRLVRDECVLLLDLCDGLDDQEKLQAPLQRFITATGLQDTTPRVGEPYDARLQVCKRYEAGAPHGTITRVVRRGLSYKTLVRRPAEVVVGQ